ncbi:M16 family metallopeptidase [Aestuariivirga sp.]|uniref:M16 family metallopeptidase n=1 Tax=Aestuariivirga sp. TaxID=2650926 RepID=UPI0039E3544F
MPLTEFTLKNGLKVILVEDHRTPVIFHAIAYKVGSADDEPGKSGVAHFLEHLLFKGTAKYPDGSFDRIMGENGAENNAFTTTDITVYYERLSSSLLGLAMELDADRMQNLQLSPEVFESERKVVLEEHRQTTESNPYAEANEVLQAALFKTHPYGIPTLGHPEEVQKLTLQDVLSYYRSHYMPGNAVVFVVGDANPGNVRELAERFYGPLQNPGAVPVRKRPAEPVRTAPERLEMADGRISDSSFIRDYLVPARSDLNRREVAANAVLAYILSGSSDSRFDKQLVNDARTASAAGASYSGRTITYGTFRIYATASAGGDVGQLEKAVDGILQDVVKNGVTADELSWAKNAMLASYIYDQDTPLNSALAIGTSLLTGEKREDIFLQDKAFAQVTRDDVKAAAARIFKTRHNVTIVLRPKT